MKGVVPLSTANMVQAITVLTVLKMMTKAQTSCGSGSINGKLMYERLPNIQLQGFDDDIVRDTAPPFMVLEKCEDLCLRDRASNSVVRTCTSFDFQPGSRIATYNGGPEYEESTCYLTAEQARPEGIGSLMLVPNSVHFTEICITSKRPERECPNRRYVFERHPRKKLKLMSGDMKEVSAANRTECEDKCLDEFSFVCRSATFDMNMRMCTLSRFTRRTHPELLEDNAESEYLENTCLNADRRCDGLAVFIKEENKRLGGPFEVDSFTNLTLDECQAMCVRAEKYFCRSIEYDEMTQQCTISEEDSISQKDDIGIASSPSHHFYDFACLDSPRGQEYPDNSVTSHLFTGKKPDTAFQRYRNSRLGGEHHSEISGRSLSECLDECLRQPSFQCRSAEYSERYRTCRLTRYNQKDGMRIIYDADYDYYENLMLSGDDSGSGGRPTDDHRRPSDDRYRPGSRYPSSRPPPPSRYPPSSFGDGSDYPDRRPPSSPAYFDRYPGSSRPPHPSVRPDDDDRYYRPNDIVPYRPNGGHTYYQGGGGASGGGGGAVDRYPPPHSIDDRDRYPLPRPYPHYPDRNEYDRYPGRDRRPIGYDNTRYSEPDYYYNDADYYRNRYHYGGGNRYNDRYGGGKYGSGGGGDGGGGGGAVGRPGPERWPYRPDRRPSGRPVDDKPVPTKRPISPGPDGPIYDNGNAPFGFNRPYGSRCDEPDNFKQRAARQRVRKEYVKRYMTASSLDQCQQECIDSRDFQCRSLNFKNAAKAYDEDRDNCELIDRDTRDMELSSSRYFETATNFDFYERVTGSRQGLDAECLDVSQICNEEGMEFTLRTQEGFYGRIYTYGYYDRCFFRGNGGTVNVLRITGVQGYPECGTQRFGDTLTNIVVVQISDHVQTGKDKRFNLTCLFRGPGEAVVSSGFIGAGSGSPIPIEYLPAENTLSSKVRLMILYQGRPTTTIAVGDPLTFRIEAQDGYNYASDIFATNVVARDPYSGRSVQLIDRYGCPVDHFVFPELDRGRSGDTLEARFNAFKIPESNFLVFEATVRTCRDGCQPAYCQKGTGRSEPSFGKRRRRRDLNQTIAAEVGNATTTSTEVSTLVVVSDTNKPKNTTAVANADLSSEYVREMIEVFDSREELQQEALRAEPALSRTVCLDSAEYQGLVVTVFFLIALLMLTFVGISVAYRRYWPVIRKNLYVDRSPVCSSSPSALLYPSSRSPPRIGLFGSRPFMSFNPNAVDNRPFASLTNSSCMDIAAAVASGSDNACTSSTIASYRFEDPSEPIYTDPSMFEKSRSLRSISVSQKQM